MSELKKDFEMSKIGFVPGKSCFEIWLKSPKSVFSVSTACMCCSQSVSSVEIYFDWRFKSFIFEYKLSS